MNNLTSKSDDKPKQNAVLLGAFNRSDKTDITLSLTAQKYGSEIKFDFNAAVIRQMGVGECEVRIFNNLMEEFRSIAAVGMGPDPGEEKDDKNVFQRRELDRIRNATGAGARSLQERGIDEIYVKFILVGETVADGATLGV